MKKTNRLLSLLLALLLLCSLLPTAALAVSGYTVSLSSDAESVAAGGSVNVSLGVAHPDPATTEFHALYVKLSYNASYFIYDAAGSSATGYTVTDSSTPGTLTISRAGESAATGAAVLTLHFAAQSVTSSGNAIFALASAKVDAAAHAEGDAPAAATGDNVSVAVTGNVETDLDRYYARVGTGGTYQIGDQIKPPLGVYAVRDSNYVAGMLTAFEASFTYDAALVKYVGWEEYRVNGTLYGAPADTLTVTHSDTDHTVSVRFASTETPLRWENDQRGAVVRLIFEAVGEGTRMGSSWDEPVFCFVDGSGNASQTGITANTPINATGSSDNVITISGYRFTAKLAPDAQAAFEGGNFTVPLFITTGTGWLDYSETELTVTYDKDKVSYVGATPVNGLTFDSSTTPGQLVISGTGLTKSTDRNTPLTTLTFRANNPGDAGLGISGTVNGVTAAADVTAVTVFPVLSWAGSGTSDDPYQLTSEAELRLLAQFVNLGQTFKGKYLKLMNDVTLTGQWTPIGFTKDGYLPFSGTFDGNNKTVRGLSITSEVDDFDHYGFFGVVEDATVKNLSVAGTIDLPDAFGAGGVAGESIGTSRFENCSNFVNLTAEYIAGGIVGELYDGVITGCMNYADICVGVGGGITARFVFGTIENCGNYGTITGGGGGGIACKVFGAGSEGVSISGCFNMGDVSSTSNGSTSAAGILAAADGGTGVAITNCYNAGSIHGECIGLGSYDTYVAGILASTATTGTTISNCYNVGELTKLPIQTYTYLGRYGEIAPANEIIADGWARTITGVTPIAESVVRTTNCYTAAQISALTPSAAVAALGSSAWQENINGGAPKLLWESNVIDTELRTVTFNVTGFVEVTPTVTVYKSGTSGETYTANSDGTFSLPLGRFSYAVSADGYVTETGAVSIVYGDKAVSVGLLPAAEASFTLTPADATVTVSDEDGNAVAPVSTDSGSCTYSLYRGKLYTYAVTKAGFVSATGSFTAVSGLDPFVITLTSVASGTEISGGDTITAGGTYIVSPGATGLISINTTDPVTLIGTGISETDKYSQLTVKGLVDGIDLTLRDLYICNSDTATASGEAVPLGLNILDFQGVGNDLRLSGTNLLESVTYVAQAAIHVGPDAALTLSGDGVLYMYKYTQGAGIGGNAEEACGAITFADGTYYIKGSKTGAVIGGDAMDNTAVNGAITISGGALNVMTNSKGAAIGTSNAGTCAGTVFITGGTTTITTDFSGSAIGYGGSRAGTAGALAITGGSLKTYITTNSAQNGGWTGVSRASISDANITATKQDASGNPVYRAVLDTSSLPGDVLTVKVGENTVFSGVRHTTDYSKDISSTIANWKDSIDKNLYLYLAASNTPYNLTVTDNLGTEKHYTATWNSASSDFTIREVNVTYYDVTFTGTHATAYVESVAKTTMPVSSESPLLTFTVAADTGYSISNVALAGGSTAALVQNPDGSYTLSDISAATEVVVTTELKTYSVGFVLSPADAAITVTDSIGNPLTGTSSNVFTLTHGVTYSYTVSKSGYTSRSGELMAGTDFTTNLTGDAAIRVTLSEAGGGQQSANTSTTWDGESLDKSWSGSGTASDPYIIASAAELAGLADAVNAGSPGDSMLTGVCFELTNNIDLNNFEWTSIGGGDAQVGFNGTFDGGGHVVSNLYIHSTADWTEYYGRNRGLFGIIDADGTVKNLGVSGYVYAQRSVGGIAGKNNGAIDSCYNAAEIYATDSKGVGGIVGANWNQSTVSNCYNVGKVTSYYADGSAGGIAGENEYRIVNCYNAAEVISPLNAGGIVGSDKHTGGGAQAGAVGTGTCENCYYLNGTLTGEYTGGIAFEAETNSNTVYGVGSTELKAKAASLGGAFKADSDNLNNGYPVLIWQTSSSGGNPVSGAPGGAVTPPAPADVVVDSSTTVTDNTAKTTVTEDAVSDSVEAAVENESDGVVIKSDANNRDVGSTAVELPKAAVESIADAKLDLTVETADGANIILKPETLDSITEQAAGNSIEIIVTPEDKAAAEQLIQEADGLDAADVDLDKALAVSVVVESDGKKITSFSGALTIDLPVDSGYTEGESYKVYQISDDGSVEILSGKCVKRDGKLFVEVAVSHLSTFVVTNETTLAFTDVALNAWFYDAVAYCKDKGLMDGIGNNLFNPNGTLTRAMMVTVLHRLAGEPAVAEAATFTDVPTGQWYSDAIAWAEDNKIVDGYGNGVFGPNDSITREQMATILLRYSDFNGYDLSKVSDLAAYTDAAEISSWALAAMKWANAEGLITGRTDTTLVPGGTANRAEVATILMRFCENIVK